MTETKSVGVSKTVFAIGIIFAIITSGLVASIVSMQLAEGPKGDKGDTGATGATGPAGPMGPIGATYIVNVYGSNCLATRYDGIVVYNGTDASTAIQSTINLMSDAQIIVILGDIDVNSEIEVLKAITYYHYGIARIHGDFAYLKIGDKTKLVEKGLFVHVTSISGPYQPVETSADRTTGIGIRLVNCAQNSFEFGRIGECWTAIYFSKEGGASATLSDNKFYWNNIEGCNKAVYFEGAATLDESPFMEGNEFHGNIFGNYRGIEIDANTKDGWGTFMGVIDNAPVPGSKDFYNFSVHSNGWLILTKFIRMSESRFTPYDMVISPSS